MKLSEPSLDNLINLISRLPGLGPKSARRIALHLLKNKETNVFNCGYGKGYSVLEVINEANNITGNKIKFEFSKRRRGDAEKLVADVNKINKYIKWQPRYNNLKKIIESSINWEKKINEKNL